MILWHLERRRNEEKNIDGKKNKTRPIGNDSTEDLHSSTEEYKAIELDGYSTSQRIRTVN
jgi:hypothetical protein